MKTVIQLIPFLNDAGAENIVKNYCLFLDKAKYDSIVITLFDYCNDCYVYNSLVERGIKIITVYDKGWHKSWLRKKIESLGQDNKESIISRVWNRLFADRAIDFFQLRFEKRTGRKLKRLLKTINPDIIHAHLHIQNYLRWAIKVSKKGKNTRVFYTCHNLPVYYFSGRELNNTRYLISKINMQVIALHDSMRDEINGILSINNTVVLKNWIDFSRFRSITESKSSIRKSMGIPEDSFVIGNVGRIVEQKNQVFLVEVLNCIVKMKHNAFLVIVGDGFEIIKRDLRELAKKYNIENRLLLLGVRSDVERVYKALDVFMLPSIFEGLGMVAVEAQVAGLRCLLSDHVPRETYLCDTTFYLSLNDANKWAEAALQNTKNKNSFNNIDDYNISYGIKELEKIYDS